MENKPTLSIFSNEFAKVFCAKNGEYGAISHKVLEEETKKVNSQFKLQALLQNSNAIIGLKQALLEIFKFKRVYLSLFAERDDSVVISNVKHSIDQCLQAKNLQMADPDYMFNHAIFIDLSSFQIIMNECIEHFVEILNNILKCLSLAGGTAVEYVAQTHTWTGWAQNGHMALCAYNCLVKTLSRFETLNLQFTEDEKTMINDMKLISKGFKHIIESYMGKRYPQAETLLEFFGKNDDVINEDSLKLLEVDKESEKRAPQRWNFGGIFG